MSRFHVFGAFWTRFGFLGIRAKEFYNAACAVGCVSELRVRDALNHAKRTSDATGKAIQPEGSQKARPEAQARCQGLNMESVSVTIRPSGSPSARADLMSTESCQLARFGPFFPVSLQFYTGSGPFLISSILA